MKALPVIDEGPSRNRRKALPVIDDVKAHPLKRITVMDSVRRLAIDIPSGYQSHEAASFVAQMDNLSERMGRDTRDLTCEDLTWQPEPGMNTIGMLLAHIAIWEAFWIKRVITDDPDAKNHLEEILGVPFGIDGIPIPPDGVPPASLTKEIPFFDDLLTRARTYTTAIARPLTDPDMEREIQLPRTDQLWTATPRWTFYHILEHQAGHYGQILLLKRMKASRQ
jgi:uncharacterized damage-inducible protein DinB